MREAIDSILNQTFRDFEFLIINDGSRDASRDIILSYRDPRIRLIDNEVNEGLTISLNKGLHLARGKYIARMDADDISLPERLGKQVAFIEANPDYGAVGCWGHFIDESGTPFQEIRMAADFELILAGIFFGNQMMHSSVLMDKDFINEIGGYNTMFQKAQDYELWFRVIGHDKKVANLTEFLHRYRSHDENITNVSGSDQYYFSQLAVKKGLEIHFGRDTCLNIIKSIQDVYRKTKRKSFTEKISVIFFLSKFRTDFQKKFHSYSAAITQLDINITLLINSLFNNFLTKRIVRYLVLSGVNI